VIDKAELTRLDYGCYNAKLIDKYYLFMITKIMKAEFTAIIKKEGDWWLGWVKEVPGANGQERTKEELMISLKEATKEILELYRQKATPETISEFEEMTAVPRHNEIKDLMARKICTDLDIPNP